MELDQFLERNIVEFLETKIEMKKSEVRDREEDYGIYLTKDYLKELEKALDSDEITKAKMLFEELKDTHNRLPKNSTERKKLYVMLEQMYSKIESYMNLHFAKKAQESSPVNVDDKKLRDLAEKEKWMEHNIRDLEAKVEKVSDKSASLKMDAISPKIMVENIPKESMISPIPAIKSPQEKIITQPVSEGFQRTMAQDVTNNQKVDKVVVTQEPPEEKIIIKKQEYIDKTEKILKSLPQPNVYREKDVTYMKDIKSKARKKSKPIIIPKALRPGDKVQSGVQTVVNIDYHLDQTVINRAISETLMPENRSGMRIDRKSAPEMTKGDTFQKPLSSAVFEPSDPEKGSSEIMHKPVIISRKPESSDSYIQTGASENNYSMDEPEISKDIPPPLASLSMPSDNMKDNAKKDKLSDKDDSMDKVVYSFEASEDKKSVKQLYEQGLKNLFSNNYEEAIKLFEKVLEIRPNHRASMIRMSECKEAIRHG